MAKKKSHKKANQPLPKAKEATALDWSKYWVPALVILITAILFWPALSYDFVNWDDDVNVYENPYIASLTWDNIIGIFTNDVIGNYNPLPILTFAIENHFFPMDTYVMHLDNVLLHLLATYLVFVLVRKLGLTVYWAGAVALLFGIHPLRVESVVWITERKDVLFTVFYLAALIYYCKYKVSKETYKPYLYLVFLFFVMSLFSKIQAVALPLSIVGIDYFLGKKISIKLFLDKWAFFLVSLIAGVAAIYLLGQNNSLDDITGFGLFDRLFVGAYSFVVYLIKFVYPYFMCPLYPYPEQISTWFYLALIPAVAYGYLLYWAHSRDKRWLVFGLWFFLANVIFMLQILSAGQGFIADRFTYVPYIGLWFSLAYGLQLLTKRKPDWNIMAYGGLAIYAILLGFLTREYMPVWQNGHVMWSYVIDHYPNTSTPFGNRGYWLRSNARPQEAITDFNKAISLSPNKAGFYNSRGRAHFDLGQLAKALADYNQAISLEDNMAEYYTNRSAALGASNRLQEALADLNKAEQIAPDLTNIYLNRSLVYNQLGDVPKAQQDIQWLLQRLPNRADLWFESAVNHSMLNQSPEALAAFTRAIKLDGQKGQYYLERAKLHYRMGQKQAGKQDAQKAQQLGSKVPASLLQ